jgi:hypothetical protein
MRPFPSKRYRSAKRRGYVIVLVALMMFGFMALAALVIDMGVARLTQRQMQIAVDSAALEGLRFRDAEFFLEADPQEVPRSRRQRASDMAAWHFDDDLLAADEDAIGFGAGPIIEFSGGAGFPDLVASQEMTIPPESFYKPIGTAALRLNEGNDPAGDMVAGRFRRDQMPGEDAEYRREDFDPAANGNAFLVRMRRSGEVVLSGIDASGNRSSSAGPPLPYLFGRGSLIDRRLVASGITVRATAIADARPVVCVGAGHPGVLGSLGLAVSLDDWDNLVDDDGNDGEVKFHRVTGVVIGEQIGPEVAEDVEPATGYMAIFSPQVGFRVVGFGCASIAENGVVTKKMSRDRDALIAPENASAVFVRPIEGSREDLAIVIQLNRDLVGRPDILHAPVLAR